MKKGEIRQMTADELSLKLQELEEERWKLRFRSGTQKIDNPLRLRILRRDIARIKTALRQSELGKQKIAK
jgi:large subunit ribosomal protein L29